MQILLIGPPGLFREGIAALFARFREGAQVSVADRLATPPPHASAPDCVIVDGDAFADHADQADDIDDADYARMLAPSMQTTQPVIVLLTHATRQRVGALIAAGASGCVEKSASADTLFSALRLALAGGIPLPDSLRTTPDVDLDHNNATDNDTDNDAAPHLRLTPRQIEVLALVARGRSNKAIARQLDMAEATVKTHLSAIFKLLNVTSRGEASVVAARMESIRDAQADNAASGRVSIEHLLADADTQHFRAGEVLFRKGEPGGELFYVTRGTVLLSELGIELNAGALLGEIGLFSPERRRTATAVCKTDCQMRIVSAADAIRLYYQDPEFALYLIRLLAGRLRADQSRPS